MALIAIPLDNEFSPPRKFADSWSAQFIRTYPHYITTAGKRGVTAAKIFWASTWPSDQPEYAGILLMER